MDFYFTEELLKINGKDIKGMTVAVSGAGNVASMQSRKLSSLSESCNSK